jgi:hypothetical protein
LVALGDLVDRGVELAFFGLVVTSDNPDAPRAVGGDLDDVGVIDLLEFRLFGKRRAGLPESF